LTYLIGHGLEREPIETFLASEKHMVLNRMERVRVLLVDVRATAESRL